MVGTKLVTDDLRAYYSMTIDVNTSTNKFNMQCSTDETEVKVPRPEQRGLGGLQHTLWILFIELTLHPESIVMQSGSSSQTDAIGRQQQARRTQSVNSSRSERSCLYARNAVGVNDSRPTAIYIYIYNTSAYITFLLFYSLRTNKLYPHRLVAPCLNLTKRFP